MHLLGANVTVVERGEPLAHASQAAAGMLAAYDPDNPPELLPLAKFSLALYPGFLEIVEKLSGQPVPFHTSLTLQSIQHGLPDHPLPNALHPGSHHFTRLPEHSLDPRQLAPALLAAVRKTTIRLVEHTSLRTVTASGSAGLQVDTTAGPIRAAQIVYTLGPWSFAPVIPRKGQMLAVRIPHDLPLDFVVRTPEVYIVPRTRGPRSGQAIIGATIEDAGFSTHTDPESLARLRAAAAAFLPALADEQAAPMLDQWAGLRPATPDHLPLLGASPNDPRQFLATGHYRNGILLAPATAHVLAALLAGETPAVDLKPFSPQRFESTSTNRTSSPIFAQQP